MQACQTSSGRDTPCARWCQGTLSALLYYSELWDHHRAGTELLVACPACNHTPGSAQHISSLAHQNVPQHIFFSEVLEMMEYHKHIDCLHIIYLLACTCQYLSSAAAVLTLLVFLSPSSPEHNLLLSYWYISDKTDYLWVSILHSVRFSVVYNVNSA